MATTSSTDLQRIDLTDQTATDAFAARLAAVAMPGDAILLEGDLGAGKTAFARAFVNARAASAGEGPVDVPSPTFTLVQSYEFDTGAIWHFDLYRLGDEEEVLELGWDDARATAIALVEWPDRLGRYAPEDALTIRLAYGAGPTERVAQLVGTGDWPDRLRLETADG